MWEALFASLHNLWQWPGPLLLLLGTVGGLLFGAIPGLNGPILLALLIPLTIPLGPTGAMLLIGSMMGAVTLGGSIPAILLNAPGTETNAATSIEGFPLAQQGQAHLALGTSAVSSALGGIFGLILLILIMPLGYQIILSFSYPENFMLALMGITLIAVVTQGELIKGLIAGGIGLMLTFIGSDPFTGELRYVFGIDYLWDGISFISALIGLFAVAEVLDMMVRGGTIAEEKSMAEIKGFFSGIILGFRTVLANVGLFLRSSVIGFLIGVIPGVGGTVATFITYMQAVQTTKNKERFGKGEIRGVVATESANDAKDGGALLPTLLLGLPGSAVMAVLLGLFLLHGITPGPQILTEDLDLVAILINAHIFGNIIVAFLGLLLAPYVARLTSINVTIIAPVILAFSLLGSYAVKGLMGDVIVTLLFGFLGYGFKKFGFSRIAAVIALVLGSVLERSFHLTISTMGIAGFFTRPISLIMFLITVALLVWVVVSSQRRQKASAS